MSLDPHKTNNFSSSQAWGNITYQSLTMFDEKLKPVPSLAESWENPDPTTWILHLRKGVKFHNGRDLEAEDVVFWKERASSKEVGSFFWSWFKSIDKVEAVDKSTVKVSLSAPMAAFLAVFAGMRNAAIMPREWVPKANLAIEAVGTGPFKIVEFVPQGHIKYVRFPDYWEKGLPYLTTSVHRLRHPE